MPTFSTDHDVDFPQLGTEIGCKKKDELQYFELNAIWVLKKTTEWNGKHLDSKQSNDSFE